MLGDFPARGCVVGRSFSRRFFRCLLVAWQLRFFFFIVGSPRAAKGVFLSGSCFERRARQKVLCGPRCSQRVFERQPRREIWVVLCYVRDGSLALFVCSTSSHFRRRFLRNRGVEIPVAFVPWRRCTLEKRSGRSRGVRDRR